MIVFQIYLVIFKIYVSNSEFWLNFLNGLSIAPDSIDLMDQELVEFVVTSRIQLELDFFIFEIEKNIRFSNRFNRSNGSHNLV